MECPHRLVVVVLVGLYQPQPMLWWRLLLLHPPRPFHLYLHPHPLVAQLPHRCLLLLLSITITNQWRWGEASLRPLALLRQEEPTRDPLQPPPSRGTVPPALPPLLPLP